MSQPVVGARCCFCCQSQESGADRLIRCHRGYICAFCRDGGHQFDDEMCVLAPAEAIAIGRSRTP